MLITYKGIIPTPYAPLETWWTAEGLYSCEFAAHPVAGSEIKRSTVSARANSFKVAQRELEAAVATFFETGELQFVLSNLDFAGVTDFQYRVLKACHEIPSGQTLTYGELAELAGSPNSARAVGRVMASNRWPIVIPCHRVIGAAGKLTGYSGSGGLRTKQHLLEFETLQALRCSTNGALQLG